MLSIIIGTYNGAAILGRCLDHVAANTRSEYELIIIDNASTDEAPCVIDGFVAQHPDIRVVRERNSENLGFIPAYNRGGQLASGDYLCILNNDLFVPPGWDTLLLDEFLKNPRLGQAGINVVCNRLGRNGEGYMERGGEAEYIEGSLFIIPRRVYEQIGLFDDGVYSFAYFEDSDLSLRIREAGYEIKSVTLPGVIHLHAKTSTLPEVASKIKEHYEHNRRAFVARWWPYFTTRRFERKLLVIREGAIGDVLLATPAIAEFKRQCPHVEIHVKTACGGILEGNPDVSAVIPWKDRTDLGQYDAVVNLDMAYEYNPRGHITEIYAKKMGVTARDLRPRFFLEDAPDMERRLGVRGVDFSRPYVVVDLSALWPSRQWPAHRFAAIIDRLKNDLGLQVVSLGSTSLTGAQALGEDVSLVAKTTLQEVAYVISRSRLFIGGVSLLCHIAQAVGAPAVIVHGCTLPENCCISDERTRHIVSAMDCSGCRYDEPFPQTYIQCRKVTNECIQSIETAPVMNAAKELLAP